jgi:hypothetical protein
VGLAETKNFAEGYEAIFGSRTAAKKPAKARPKASKSKPKSKKKSAKKK